MERDLTNNIYVKLIASNIYRINFGNKINSALNRYCFVVESENESAVPDNFDLSSAMSQFNINETEVSFVPRDKEDWIGFGDVTRERMYHRGHKIDCWIKNVQSYIPVPLFMSTRGYAILVNSTHRVKFDMCATDPKRVTWCDHGNKVDFYLFTGGSFIKNIKLYTQLSGKPKLPPEWAFGLWYICRTQANDYEVVNDAVNFRREQIPCDIIGLEPGWMDKDYDLSVDKKWCEKKFSFPSYNKQHNFISTVKRMGFHMELWECNEYDLSFEEERRLGEKMNADVNESRNFHIDGEQDMHFSWPRFVDTLTRKNEAWFEHHKKFIDQGINCFKQDGAFQVCEHPDRVWGNGMLDEEMHNLYPLLYSRQMYDDFKKYVNKRPVVFTPSGWTGFQAYSSTWTGDTGGHLETLGAMLNTAVFAHQWVTNDMEVTQPEGIHFGYLLPWSQINSWTYFRMPWVQGENLLKMHQFYSHLRSRLIPYIYSWAQQSVEHGLPLLMRPLQLEFEDDLQCRNITSQYLLGRDLLISIYKNKVYLPKGRWKDFWTGKVFDGLEEYKINWPENRGGGLFIREGAIVPFGPVMQYRQQKTVDKVELYIFPISGEEKFDLYEDDGISFDYQNGEYALTTISCNNLNNELVIKILPPVGNYTVHQREWSFVIALDKKPKKVNVSQWEWNDSRQELRLSSKHDNNIIINMD